MINMVWRAYVEGNENNMRLGAERGRRTALLHGLHGIFNLVDATLRTPRRNVVVVLIAELESGEKGALERRKAAARLMLPGVYAPFSLGRLEGRGRKFERHYRMRFCMRFLILD